MPATRYQISQWFDKGVKQNATHMIIACDTFESPDACCYPVYVEAGQNPRERVTNGDRIMECYSLALPKEEQLNELRAQNWETPNGSD